MNQRQITGWKIAVVLGLGVLGAFGVPMTYVENTPWGSTFDIRCDLVSFAGGCGSLTFGRALLVGGAILIALNMWQRELKRQGSATPTHEEGSPS